MCSLFILFWCCFLSIFLAYFFLSFTLKKRFYFFFLFLKEFLNIPSLVLAPLLISLGYLFFKQNLICPVMIKGNSSLLLYSFFPSLVLAISSGLLQVLLQNISHETNFWQKKPFFIVEKAMGIASYRRLNKIILLKSISDSWYKSLPWIFSELMIIESMFNIPGLGLALWNTMKERQLFHAFLLFLSMLGLFLLCHAIVRFIHQWIGRKLESYL